MRATGTHIELKAGDIIVNYNDEGPEGLTVIFIHGLVLNKAMWRKQAEALKGSYRVIAYDVRGHGKTGPGREEQFTLELFADDLIRFMDILDIHKAVICGLSMGGYIALRAMEKYPERFQGLVLCDTQCIADTPEAREKRMKTIESIESLGKHPFAVQNAKNIFLPESFEAQSQDTDEAIKMAMEMEPENMCKTLLALANRNETCSRLGEINVPVMILVGKEDKITPVERAQFMKEKIKNSELHIIENAAHISNVENAQAFNNYLKAFLEKLS